MADVRREETAKSARRDTMLTTVLVEDSPSVRDRLRRLMEDIGGLRVVGEFEDEPTAYAGILEQAPGLVILDVWLRTGSGLNLLRSLRAHGCVAVVIVFTQHDEPAIRDEFSAAGADAFFSKTAQTVELAHALRRLVHSGRVPDGL